MSKKRYSILSFIIGKNYEILREVDNVQDDVEYILVTDDKDLKSSTWTIVYDQNLEKFKSPFERCFYVRYNPFHYCSTDICMTIDGSIKVKQSVDEIIDKFDKQQYDLSLMPHPLWADFYNEYKAWISMRGYPQKNAMTFFSLIQQANYDIRYLGLYQLCFTVKRNLPIVRNADQMTWQLLQNLSIRNGEFERLDQTVYSYVLNRYFSDIVKVLPVSEQIVRSKSMQWYWHKSENPNMNIYYDISKPDMKYLFNKKVECMYLL